VRQCGHHGGRQAAGTYQCAGAPRYYSTRVCECVSSLGWQADGSRANRSRTALTVAPVVWARLVFNAMLCVCWYGQCFGSIQHLKRRFGSGFTSELKLASPTPDFLQRVCTQVDGALAQAGSDLRYVAHHGYQGMSTSLSDSGMLRHLT
jgi:hypothetical protein